MRSIKPGRGPSAMGAVGGIIGIVFGIGWTILAYHLTRNAPFPVVGILFPLFGVCFVIFCAVSVAYEIRNAVSKDRFSIADVTTGKEEPDPLNTRFGRNGGEAVDQISERLQRLTDLEARGAISKEEYQVQRERILSEL